MQRVDRPTYLLAIHAAITQLEYDWDNVATHGEGDVAAELEDIDRRIHWLEERRMGLNAYYEWMGHIMYF